ncbi:MAG: hypothetical protein ACI9OJ_001948 [Myxococcota bacterium]|jgi:hypothetical protein
MRGFPQNGGSRLITGFIAASMLLVLLGGCGSADLSALQRLQRLRYLEAMRIADRSPDVAMARLEGVLLDIPEYWDEAEEPPEITTWRLANWIEPDADDAEHPPYTDAAPDLRVFITMPGPVAYALVPLEDRIWQLWPIVRVEKNGDTEVVAGGFHDFLADSLERLAEDEDYTAGAQEAWLRLRLGRRDRAALEERITADREYWAEYSSYVEPDVEAEEAPPDDTADDEVPEVPPPTELGTDE